MKEEIAELKSHVEELVRIQRVRKNIEKYDFIKKTDKYHTF